MHSLNVSYLVSLKEKSCMTLQEISDASAVPLPTVKRIFAGSTESPSITTLADIVDALGGSLDTLVGIKTDTALCINNHTEIGVKAAYDDALASSRASFENAYMHEIEHLKTKDKWLLRMFTYCVVLTVLYTVLVVIR